MTIAVTKADVPLVQKAAVLARSSPKAWSEFLAEIGKLTDRAKDQCVSSPVDTLPVMQGGARALRDLYATLEQCIANADKLAASNVK